MRLEVNSSDSGRKREMGLADIFVARDGDATTDGLLITVIFFTLLLAVAGVACWWLWQRLRHVEQRAAASDGAGLRLAADTAERERRLEGAVYDLCGRLLVDIEPPAPPERHLKCVKSG